MKTSNKYIIAFFLFILTGILVLFIGTRCHFNDLIEKIVNEEINLQSFSVIVAEPDTRFNIESGDSNKLIISYKDKSKQKLPLPYLIKNDTLYFVEKLVPHNLERYLTIQCKRVKTLIAKNTNDINLNNFCSDSLTIISDNGKVFFGQSFNRNSKISEIKISNVSVISKNDSYMDFSNTKIGQMNIQLSASSAKFWINNSIHFLSVNLNNGSNIEYIGDDIKVNKIDFKADSTSSYHLVDNIRSVTSIKNYKR